MQELAEIEALVNRANFRNEFLEAEMQSKLEKIFRDNYHFPALYYNYLKQLLFMITGIEKSSNFGYFFYENLHENPFPFSREVLKSAVYNESYYNLNDKALKSYIRVYLIETGFDSKTILDYDDIIPEGHGYHYFDTFAEIEKHKFQCSVEVRPCFFDIIYAVLNRNEFPMTQKKATTIVSFLKLKQFSPAMIGKAYQILHASTRTSDEIMVLVHLIKAISIVEKTNLPKALSEAIYEIINCRCNGSLPEKFSSLDMPFHEFVNVQIEATHLV